MYNHQPASINEAIHELNAACPCLKCGGELRYNCRYCNLLRTKCIKCGQEFIPVRGDGQITLIRYKDREALL